MHLEPPVPSHTTHGLLSVWLGAWTIEEEIGDSMFPFLFMEIYYEMALMQTMWYNEAQNASVASNFLHNIDTLQECVLTGFGLNYVDFFS